MNNEQIHNPISTINLLLMDKVWAKCENQIVRKVQEGTTNKMTEQIYGVSRLAYIGLVYDKGFE